MGEQRGEWDLRGTLASRLSHARRTVYAHRCLRVQCLELADKARDRLQRHANVARVVAPLPSVAVAAEQQSSARASSSGRQFTCARAPTLSRARPHMPPLSATRTLCSM